MMLRFKGALIAMGSEVNNRVIVPEDFLGFAMREVHSKNGSIKGVEPPQGGLIAFRASLPIMYLNELVDIVSEDTRTRGKVELED